MSSRLGTPASAGYIMLLKSPDVASQTHQTSCAKEQLEPLPLDKTRGFGVDLKFLWRPFLSSFGVSSCNAQLNTSVLYCCNATRLPASHFHTPYLRTYTTSRKTTPAPTGARVTTPLKPTGRSRSASIESAAEFFSSPKARRPGDQRDDDGDPAAAAGGADAGGRNSVSAGGLSNGGSARKRQRDEAGGGAGGGEAARLGGAVKGRVPRKHQEQRRGLPIFAHKAGIIRAVKEHQVCGKSTWSVVVVVVVATGALF